MQVVRAIGVLEPGGAQLSALRLSRALRPHGIETLIVAGDASPAGLDVARAHGFEVEHFSEVRGLQWNPDGEFAGWLAERVAGADLVHGHMFGAWWAAARAAPADVPVVASEHNALSWPRDCHDEHAGAVAGRLGCFFGHGPEVRGATFTFSYELRDADGVCTRGNTRHACVDRARMRAVRVPEWLVQALREHE